ncbi:hypothetical protein JCM8115_005278 [Rhodotorula mucilaginosa]
MWNASSPYAGFAPHFPTPPPQSSYPFYHVRREQVVPGMSDGIAILIVPVLVYWAYSLVFCLIDNLGWDCFERHRIHEPEEVKTKNRVTVPEVIKAVLLQQAIQIATGWVVVTNVEEAQPDPSIALNAWGLRLAHGVVSLAGTKRGGEIMARYGQQAAEFIYWWGVPAIQFVAAAFILDGWQYMMHRTAHQVTYLYRTIHSWHHRLYVPYAFGALYNHPFEGFALDTCGSVLAHELVGFTTRQALLFFIVSTMKTVDDHCGFAFPWDPFQHVTGNNADYHDIHHQVAGLKKNYSQPWCISWDLFFGTRMTREEYQSKVAKRVLKGEVPKSKVNGPNELAAPPTSERNGMALKEKVN